MWRADSLEKTLMLGNNEARGGGGRGRDGWMTSLTQWTWVWTNSGRLWRDRKGWHAAVHRVTKSWTQLSNWPTTTSRTLNNNLADNNKMFLINHGTWVWKEVKARGPVIFKWHRIRKSDPAKRAKMKRIYPRSSSWILPAQLESSFQ